MSHNHHRVVERSSTRLCGVDELGCNAPALLNLVPDLFKLAHFERRHVGRHVAGEFDYESLDYQNESRDLDEEQNRPDDERQHVCGGIRHGGQEPVIVQPPAKPEVANACCDYNRQNPKKHHGAPPFPRRKNPERAAVDGPGFHGIISQANMRRDECGESQDCQQQRGKRKRGRLERLALGAVPQDDVTSVILRYKG